MQIITGDDHSPHIARDQFPATNGIQRFTRLLRTGILFLLLLLVFPAASRPENAPKVLYQSVGVSPGTRYSRPLGIFFDKNLKECYVADTGNHQVVVCDENGTPVYSFPHRISEGDEQMLGEPTSLVVDHAGRIFLVDAVVDYIDVLNHTGRRIQKIYPPEDACEEPVRFKTVALGPDDEVYAALSCRDHRVVIIDTTLSIRRSIRLDAPDAERACISGLAVDASSNIYITDPCATAMVQVYDANGSYKIGFGHHTAGFENFSFPAGVVVMSNGNIWVVDTIRQVVSCFSNDGEFLTYFGGRGNHPGEFDYPSALASDSTNLLFVLERAGNRYQCFWLSDSGQ